MRRWLPCQAWMSVEQTSGEWQCDPAQHAFVSQNLVEESAARSPVAVYERMNRLELGMEDRRLGDGRDVIPGSKGDQVIKMRSDPLVSRRDVERSIAG